MAARRRAKEDRGSAGPPPVPFGRRIALREYLWRPRAGPPRVVKVEIGTPAQTRSEWACRVRISGLPRERAIDQVVYGIDVVQALELSLQYAGKALAESPEFRAGQIEWLGGPARDPAALGLPLPMHSLQLALDNLQAFLERKPKAHVQGEWRRGLLSMMREISLDLATLAAHLPNSAPTTSSHVVQVTAAQGYEAGLLALNVLLRCRGDD
jgi:hypothetical protein